MLSQQELFTKLTTDPHFAASFVVQNNFPAIQQRMLDLGFSVSTPQAAYQQLINWSDAGGAQKLINYVSSVPYLNNAPNDTAGYAALFKQYSPAPPPAPGQKMDPALSAGLLTFATGGLSGLIPYLLGGAGGAGGMTPEQAAAQAEADKKAADEAAAKKRQMWWWIGGIGGAIVIITGILLLSAGHKHNTTVIKA